MSFEGYERFLCENGHLFSFDIYSPDLPDENWKCPICQVCLTDDRNYEKYRKFNEI
jgi:hypothetical protein